MTTQITPTAPLPAPAVDAASRLSAAFPLVEAVTVYRSAAVRAALLADLAGADYTLSAMEWDDLAHAEDLMAGARATLAEAGRLDLIGGGR